ncbi:MAG: hypothetical protein HOP12_02895 [Candidatus Eisenbacteria bacterium]|uniref:Cellobiose phosphorylase n=1 Tax=Eiseniibacteriota bacterium TaxID=2212470 RepID=A0A849SJS0_UNCEI|nr:hypothetical protein [Candidatus Eisenbacteria bacterium]
MRDDEDYFRIHTVDALPPFLMNLPTDTDLWMFVASNGGLTAGRRDPEGAVFPYETVDRLYDSPHHTGPVTVVKCQRGTRAPFSWEPLAPFERSARALQRSLSKSALGNRLVFEEVHEEAQLAFRYRWSGSDATGWVRTASLTNLGREPVVVALLDGLRNVLPSGAPLPLYQHSSCLVDAYKRVDLDLASRLATVSLTSRISDRPEPGEELRASTVWCHGLPEFRVALSLDALKAFRRGEWVGEQTVLAGQRGNYLAMSEFTLAPGATLEWHVAVDANRSHVEVARLRARLLQRSDLGDWVVRSLDVASANLLGIVGSADGLQLTGRSNAAAHHLANVMFNNLRGGVFVENDTCPRADFVAFVRARNRGVAARHRGLLGGLSERPHVGELLDAVESSGNSDLRRLGLEYLPLYFGRRHGDPSRPWNRFEISVRNPDGSRALRYEGNWRDVFQNWEALSLSFPTFIPSFVAKFLNASTVDGFNPYRITRDGVDWELLDSRDPWGGIGYWGDHQIIYLLKFLESMRRHTPGALEDWLGQEIFSYADVPYRLKPYAELLANPRATIQFDAVRNARIADRVAAIGDDGKLLQAGDGTVHHASLMEKLLVPALSKMSCLVPDGGIWMNTQRPEWNDANNALVGSGLSVVTLCYLRRYLSFLEALLSERPQAQAQVAVEVVEWMREVAAILHQHEPTLEAGDLNDVTRKQIMDALGHSFSNYRQRLYAHGFGAKSTLDAREVFAWCRVARSHVEHAIASNLRGDGLYHSYNLLTIAEDGTRATVRRLGLMLEGQVAAMSSGLVDAGDATRLVTSLFASPLYRTDLNSFLLSPTRTLPTFLERNVISEAQSRAVPLVNELLTARDTSIVERDADGALRFHASFGNAGDVASALDRLEPRERWAGAVARNRAALLDLFAEVFAHKTFMGRSERIYSYEGIGCVYWHMIAKLLLAVQEVALAAHEPGVDSTLGDSLMRDYYRIRGGLGFEKSVIEYGAFPTDPYSHTPSHAGAQQPGMTGQVKEEILTRFGELGVQVRDGAVGFDPWMLQPDDFLKEPGTYSYFDLAGTRRSLSVPSEALAFSYCQVPIVYARVAGEGWVRVVREAGLVSEKPGCWLDRAESRDLWSRRGQIERIEVGIPEDRLFRD